MTTRVYGYSVQKRSFCIRLKSHRGYRLVALTRSGKAGQQIRGRLLGLSFFFFLPLHPLVSIVSRGIYQAIFSTEVTLLVLCQSSA